MSKKLTYKYVKEYIEKENYQLLSKEYVNNSTKLELKCPKGHVYEVNFVNISSGKRCPECSGVKKHTYEIVKNFIEKEGYTLLSEKYENAHIMLNMLCSIGHKYNMDFHSFKTGNQRCPECFGNKKFSYDYIKSYVESFNYYLLSEDYKNTHDLLSVHCDKDHDPYFVSFNNFKRGKRCPICNNEKTSSKGEKEILDYVQSIYFDSVINNDRKTITNYITGYNLELDIYLPKINKAIEYNGEY